MDDGYIEWALDKMMWPGVYDWLETDEEAFAALIESAP